MSDKGKIIERTIRKALKNGWQPRVPKLCSPTPEIEGSFLWFYPDDEAYRRLNKGRDIDEIEMPPNKEGYYWGIKEILTSHEFCKALWGEENHYKVSDAVGILAKKEWQYHLQQMVIVDDPLVYLKENI